MSMMVSFVLSFFPRDVLDEILNLIESVSEDFPSYSSMACSVLARTSVYYINIHSRTLKMPHMKEMRVLHLFYYRLK